MPAAARAGRPAALAFIFVTVLLDMLAVGLVVPVLPGLVAEFLGGDLPGAARIVGLFGTVWALAQFVAAPLLGSLSDRFGRRPVILLSNLGLGLDYLLMALAPGLAWLFVARIVSGVTAASVATASAYIADVTVPERRAAGFGMLGAAFGVGFVVGPALGGALGAIDLRLPFWVAGALSLANALYGLLILPESLPRDRRGPFRWTAANPLGALRLLRAYPSLGGLAAVHFLHYMAHQTLPIVFVLYTGRRFGWREDQIGLVLAAFGIGAMIVQGLLVRQIVARIGERPSLLLGLLCGVIGFGAMGLAPNAPLFIAALPFMALWGLTGPAVQALITRAVGPAEQGRLQGAFTSVAGTTGIVGPTLFAAIFALALGSERLIDGLPFLAAALSLASAMAIAWCGGRAARRENRDTDGHG